MQPKRSLLLTVGGALALSAVVFGAARPDALASLGARIAHAADRATAGGIERLAAGAEEPGIVLTTGETFTVSEYAARVRAQVWWNGYRLTCDEYMELLLRMKSEQSSDLNIQRGVRVYEDVCATERAAHEGWREIAGDR